MSIFLRDEYDLEYHDELLDLERELLKERESGDRAFNLWLDAYTAVTQYEEEYPRETEDYYTAGL